ncbi:MAG TPA: hypothetical protein VKD91_15295, partial [Pyrinomonadaceae bacterium]|nr:hypothetical protein [Pyrinomonadaceae bacterium]
GVVSVKAKLRVNDSPEIEHQVRLYGPGDVTGLDTQQVIRTEPRNLATDFEPNYFPAIEFDRPDLPWMFTPAKADSANRLRPWLCLIVVRKQDGVSLSVDPKLPLRVLEIKAPARPDRELPDLSESFAWAHAQVTGSLPDPASLKNSLGGDPALNLSRLLCPRRLDPSTDYWACVVPTFELGRKAGLGLPIQRDQQHDEEAELKAAWTTGLAELKLPVYYHWEFRTGTGGDFESLVGLLKARDAREMPKVGKRKLDISLPGFNLAPPLPAGTTLDLEGALRVLNVSTAEWAETTRKPFQTELKKILDAPWQLITDDSGNKDPLVAPPIYGCWQAARHTVNLAPVAPAKALTWLDELNLDPRNRAVAALGTQVVQTQQEELMAAAWEQLGDIERINQLRRQAQLGRAVNAVYHVRHFSRFSQEILLKVLAPAQSRLVIEGTPNVTPRALLSQKISLSPIPDRAISAPMRRLTNPRGAISTRFQATGAPPIAIMARLNTAFVLPALKATGFVGINLVSDNLIGVPVVQRLNQVLRFERIATAIANAPRLADFKIIPEGVVPKRSLMDFQPGPADSPDADMFRKVVTAQQDYMGKLFAPATPAGVAASANLLDGDLKGKLLRSVNPEITIKARVQASLILAKGAEPRVDPLEPIMDAPDFPQPMYEALRDLSQDFLLPGLEEVLPNTVALLETNPKFVESFLVGLNAEMSSELLWRNYPTDQRGTYFRQFWDTSSAGTPKRDSEAISTWGDHQLGKNTPGTSGKVVLLIRGDLLRRYPNTVIYAVKAVMQNAKLDLSQDPKDERHPLFRGTLKPDVTFLGFDLNRNEALTDPGWFFVIQQQPTEPRFGMDEADFVKPPQPPPLKTWNDLSWRHLVNTEAELKALSHASIKTVLPDIEKAKWGVNSNSAHHAYITLQRPVRIAIHAKQMIRQS